MKRPIQRFSVRVDTGRYLPARVHVFAGNAAAAKRLAVEYIGTCHGLSVAECKASMATECLRMGGDAYAEGQPPANGLYYYGQEARK